MWRRGGMTGLAALCLVRSCAGGWFSADEPAPPPPPVRGPVQWGIMGTAKAARKLAWAIEQADNAVLTAVASRSIDRAVKFTAEHTQSMGHARFYGSYEELLGDALVEAVFVPLPTTVMKPWVVKACSAKKHVLAGRPFGSAAEVSEMVTACERHGVQFMDGTAFLHNTRTEELQRQVSGGAVGEVRRVHASVTRNAVEPGDVRLDRSLEPMAALGDVGWDAVRAALLVLPHTAPVKAQCFGLGEEGAQDMLGHITFESGALATVEAGFGYATRQRLEIVGTEKTIEVPDFAVPNDALARFMLREVQQGQFDTIAEEAPFVFEHAYQTVAMVRRFSHIAGAGSVGNPLLEPTWGEASRRTMAVLDACFASIGRGGTAVPVAALAPAQPTPPPPPPKQEQPPPAPVTQAAGSAFLLSKAKQDAAKAQAEAALAAEQEKAQADAAQRGTGGAAGQPATVPSAATGSEL